MPLVALTFNMLERMDFWTVVRSTAVWWSPIAAGFIGAFGVHLLTQSREREKWILDSKKSEYRELLSALSNAYSRIRSATAGFGNFPSADTKERDEAIFLVTDESLRLFSDRLFITNDLPLSDLRESWRKAIKSYSYSECDWTIGSQYSPIADLDSDYERIKEEIVAAANRSVPKTAWQRVMFWKE